MDADYDQRVLLGLLLDEPTRDFSEGELAALLDWPTWRVQDARTGLVQSGLANANDCLVFASWPAVRASALI